MSLKKLKGLTVVFGITIAGIVVCFALTLYTGVKRHQLQQQQEAAAPKIPVPAM